MSRSYSIDTNVIVTLNRDQPRDVYVSVWSALESLIDSGRGFMIREAFEELKAVDDECAPWAKGMTGFIQETTVDQIAIVASVTSSHPGWVQDTMNAADPFIIAHASAENLSIVTFEKMKGPGTADQNLRIPNVAKEWGVECFSFQQLAREEGWQF